MSCMLQMMTWDGPGLLDSWSVDQLLGSESWILVLGGLDVSSHLAVEASVMTRRTQPWPILCITMSWGDSQPISDAGG